MNNKVMIKSMFVLSLLSLLPLITYAQNTTDMHGKMDMKQPTQKMKL